MVSIFIHTSFPRQTHHITQKPTVMGRAAFGKGGRGEGGGGEARGFFTFPPRKVLPSLQVEINDGCLLLLASNEFSWFSVQLISCKLSGDSMASLIRSGPSGFRESHIPRCVLISFIYKKLLSTETASMVMARK